MLIIRNLNLISVQSWTYLNLCFEDYHCHCCVICFHIFSSANSLFEISKIQKNNPSFKLAHLHVPHSQSVFIRQCCVKKEDKGYCVRLLVVLSHLFLNSYLTELKNGRSTAVAELTKMKQTLITLMNATWSSTRNLRDFMTHSLPKSSKTWKEALQFNFIQNITNLLFKLRRKWKTVTTAKVIWLECSQY